MRGRGLIFNLRRHFSSGETLDIYPCRLALALLDPLDQADAFAGVQLCKQLERLIVAEVLGLLGFI